MTAHPEKIGPYEITREIGRGGMGIVYLAHDTKLDREVAIKCLPDELSDDAERLARFEREAKLLASLNHPHIATIFGIEEMDGNQYIILEYVEGETLAERLQRGAIPVDEALPIAKQIAEAIEAAHEKGVIHRDLKPANIKFTADGEVKILDFGLAKSIETRSLTKTEIANSPTIVRESPTLAGVILGTAGYLSPEQARGRPVDTRTDIFAFGCVLYEMLAGKALFAGETVSDSIGSTLHRQPDFQMLPTETPHSIRTMLRRCLVKESKQRLQSIGDVRVEIEEALSGEATEEGGGDHRVAVLQPAWRRNMHTGVTAIFLLVSLVLGYLWLTQVPLDGGAMRFEIPPPESIHFEFPIGALAEADLASQFCISPTDRMIVAWAGRAVGDPDEAPSAVCVHDLRTGLTNRLAGSEGAKFITFSPDGKQIAFAWRDPDSPREEYRRVGVGGGPVVRILAKEPHNAFAVNEFLAWASTDEILLAKVAPFRLHTVSVNTGDVREVGEVSGMEDVLSIGTPIFGYDDTIFVVGTEISGTSSFVIDLQSMTATRIIRGGGSVYPIAPDRIAFAQDHTLFVAPYDAATKSISGPVQPVLNDLVSEVAFSISATGDLLAVLGEMGDENQRQIYAMGRDGVGESLFTHRRPFTGNVDVSPDGSTIAVNIFEGANDGGFGGYLIDRATGAIGAISFGDERTAIVTQYAHDGRLAVLRMVNFIFLELVLLDPDGDAEPFVVLPESDERGGQMGFAMTRDGRHVLFKYLPNEEGREPGIYMVDISLPEAERQAIKIAGTPANGNPASISPDGRWIAYSTNASGRFQVVVQAFDPEHPEARVRAIRVSTDGGSKEFWSIDGTELLYLNLESDLLSAAVTIENDQISFAPPEVVLTREQTRIHKTVGFYHITEMPNEDRFLFIREPEAQEARIRYEYIMNWTSTLEPASSSESGSQVNP